MSLDLRIPMGLMFSLVGMILSAFGLATNNRPGFYDISLGINVNLWWGLVLLVFGLSMLLLGRRGQRRIEKERKLPPAKEDVRRGH